MQAKHATMLLTVTEVEGLAEGTGGTWPGAPPRPSSHPVVMVSKGQGRLANALSSYCLLASGLSSFQEGWYSRIFADMN